MRGFNTFLGVFFVFSLVFMHYIDFDPIEVAKTAAFFVLVSIWTVREELQERLDEIEKRIMNDRRPEL